MDPTDRDLMIRTVLAEAGAKASPEEKAAVAHVIVNRLGDPQYGATVRDVLFQRNAFEPWGAGMKTNSPMRFDAQSPDYADTGKIVDDVLSGKNADLTHGADRFQQPEIVNQRYRSGRVSQSSLAPNDAQRIGSQVFWSTRKNDQDLLSEFYRNAPTTASAQTATAESEAAPAVQSPQPAANDDALLGEFYSGKAEQPTAATEAPAKTEEPTIAEAAKQTRQGQVLPGQQQAGFLPYVRYSLQHLISQHPYAATAMAAGMNLPTLAGASVIAARTAPLLAPIGLGAFGAEKIYEYGKPLYDLLKP